jgi:lipid-A-disaccharide synthase
VRKIKRFVDLPLVIFGFEREFFRPYGIDAVFVGHPLADALASFPGRSAARRDLGLGEETVVGLLPGSRPGEIARIYPVLLASARVLAAARPGLVFITPVSSPDLRREISALASASGVPVRLVSGRAREVMAAADTVLVASGTATLETALAGTPMVVVYRVSLLSWLLALVLVKIPYISLVNIVSGRRAVPEYIQYGARPSRIAWAAARLLPGGEDRKRMLELLRPVPGFLGEPGGAARAARAILDFLARRQPKT